MTGNASDSKTTYEMSLDDYQRSLKASMLSFTSNLSELHLQAEPWRLLSSKCSFLFKDPCCPPIPRRHLCTRRSPLNEGFHRESPVYCRNLVVLDLELDVYGFAHLSVREFLEKRPEYHIHRAHADAAKACIQNLLTRYNEEQSHEERSDEGHNDEEQSLVLEFGTAASSKTIQSAASTTAGSSYSRSEQTAEADTEESSETDSEDFSEPNADEHGLAFSAYAVLYWAVHCEACGRAEREGRLSTLLASLGLFTWEAAPPFRRWVSV